MSVARAMRTLERARAARVVWGLAVRALVAAATLAAAEPAAAAAPEANVPAADSMRAAANVVAAAGDSTREAAERAAHGPAPHDTALVEFVPPVVSARWVVDVDSVTVGERFHARCEFVVPDSLRHVAPREISPGNCRILSARWKTRNDGVRELAVEAFTLGLDAARIPGFRATFASGAGETLYAWVDTLVVPVGSMLAPGDSLAPLKEPWEAPRGVPAWVWAALAALALAAAAWMLWRRRRRAPEAAPEPALPPDVVALEALTRLEREGYVERGEFKPFYSGLTDVLRRYIEARFGVEAMESTTAELVAALERARVHLDGLEALLREADLVKFARFAPGAEAARAALATARRIVARTAPRPASARADGAPEAARVANAPEGAGEVGASRAFAADAGAGGAPGGREAAGISDDGPKEVR